MGYYFLKGIVSSFLPSVTLNRTEVRRPQFRLTRLSHNGIRIPALLRNQSTRGRKLFFFAKHIGPDDQWQIPGGASGQIPMRMVYRKKISPNFYAAGFTF